MRAGERDATRERVVAAGIVRGFEAGLEMAFGRAFGRGLALETVCDGCALDAEGSDGVFSRKVDTSSVDFATFVLMEFVPFWTIIVSVSSVASACFVALLLVAGPARPPAVIALAPAPRLRFVAGAICGEGRVTYGIRASKYSN